MTRPPKLTQRPPYRSTATHHVSEKKAEMGEGRITMTRPPKLTQRPPRRSTATQYFTETLSKMMPSVPPACPSRGCLRGSFGLSQL